MGGRRGEFGVQGGTDVPHTYVKLDLKVADFAEAAEGERAGWRAAELLGAGLAESLLTLQFYSEVSVPRLTLQLTLDQEKKNKKHTHGVLCWTHTNTLLSHTLLLKHAFSHMPPSRFAAWSCSTSGNMCNTNIFLWQLHTTCCTYCICTHTHSLAVHYLVKSRWPSARLPFEREVTWRPGSSGDASHRPTSCLWPPGGRLVLIRSSKSISCIHTETGFHVNAAWRWYALISPVSSGACDHSRSVFVHICVFVTHPDTYFCTWFWEFVHANIIWYGCLWSL